MLALRVSEPVMSVPGASDEVSPRGPGRREG